LHGSKYQENISCDASKSWRAFGLSWPAKEQNAKVFAVANTEDRSRKKDGLSEDDFLREMLEIRKRMGSKVVIYNGRDKENRNHHQYTSRRLPKSQRRKESKETIPTT